MGVKETIAQVFANLATKMGYKLKEKQEIEYDYAKDGVNPTAIGANVIATITLDDSDIEINGAGARAEALREVKDYYDMTIRTNAVELALDTGDVIIRPYTDGDHIGVNVVPNSDFQVIDSIGDYLKAVAIRLDWYVKQNKDRYDLIEVQQLSEATTQTGETITVVTSDLIAYKNLKNEVPISETDWADMKTHNVVVADQLLLGRIKCPTLNRKNPNGIDGVPITFGCEDIINQIRDKYKQNSREFDKKRIKVFMDKTMFPNRNAVNSNNDRLCPDDSYVLLQGQKDGGIDKSIQVYSPDIRYDAYQSGVDFDFSILELCCGFSRGVFTKPETAFATATEMKNSLKKTFAFVKRLRKRIEYGEKMLFNAVNIIMNMNDITPVGDYEIAFDWSYDYIEETRERFNQLIQEQAIGAIPTYKVTAWAENLDDEQAKELVTEAQTVEDTAIDEPPLTE